jgi:HEAT repeat protein
MKRLRASLLVLLAFAVADLASAEGGIRAPKKPVSVATQPTTDSERMKRMAANLLRPELHIDAARANRMRGDWLARLNREKDPMARMEIVTETAQLDDADTIALLLKLLASEKDPNVRRQIELIIGYLRTTPAQSVKVADAMHSAYQHNAVSDERATILDVTSNLRTPEGVEMLRSLFAEAASMPAERVRIAGALLLLAPRVPGYNSRDFAHPINDWLKQQAKSSGSAEVRLAAAKVLAASGQENKAFLGGLAASEKEPSVRRFLLLASVQKPAE